MANHISSSNFSRNPNGNEKRNYSVRTPNAIQRSTSMRHITPCSVPSSMLLMWRILIGLKTALLQKGVSEMETERARKEVFEQEDDPGSDGQDTQLGMCKLSMDHLFLQASKQWLKSRNTVVDNRRARIVRWLQYRGFDWGVTNYVLKKLESQYPS